MKIRNYTFHINFNYWLIRVFSHITLNSLLLINLYTMRYRLAILLSAYKYFLFNKKNISTFIYGFNKRLTVVDATPERSHQSLSVKVKTFFSFFFMKQEYKISWWNQFVYVAVAFWVRMNLSVIYILSKNVFTQFPQIQVQYLIISLDLEINIKQ